MIKICLVLSSLAGGGAERFFLNLANNLNRSKFDIYFILFDASGEYQKMLPSDIKIIDLQISPTRSFISSLKIIIALGGVLKKMKPNVIFSTMGYTNLLCLIVKGVFNLKSTFLIHEAGILKHQLSFDKWGKEIKRRIYQFFCRFADLIIFPAKAVQEEFHNYVGTDPQKYRIIPTPSNFKYIDDQWLKPWEPQRFNLKMDRRIIVSMGRLERIKGFDLGITAFAKLNKDIPCYYWILGQGTEEGNLKKLARDLGVEEDVYFLGFQENPFLFIKNADIYLLSSYSETLPYALTEAMYCQRPCVVTPYNISVGEIIKNNITGILVDHFDADQLAVSMKKILKDELLKKEIGMNARQKAREFSMENLVPQYEALFEEIITNKSRGMGKICLC